MINRDKENRIVSETDGDISHQISAMRNKWGVSAAEIQDALEKVGDDQKRIEEYLVNNRYLNHPGDSPSFQKKQLNEDETY